MVGDVPRHGFQESWNRLQLPMEGVRLLVQGDPQVFGPFSHLQYRPCPECGASVASEEMEAHVCDVERWLDYQMFQLRDEVAAFDDAVVRFLDSPHGRFELWYAERERIRRAA